MEAKRSTLGSREWKGGKEGGKRVESREGGTRTDLLRYPRPARGRSVRNAESTRPRQGDVLRTPARSQLKVYRGPGTPPTEIYGF